MKKILLLLFCFQNIFAYEKIVCVTLPKSGTYLLMKCVSLIQKYSLDQSNIKPCEFAHINFGPSPAVKGLSIRRDPRAQLVSFAYNHKYKDGNSHMPRNMTIPQALTELIENYGGFVDKHIARNTEWAQFTSLRKLYDAYEKIFQQMDIYITTYEKLVGPHGGGTKEEQLHEIMAIAKHIEIEISLEIAERISYELYGGTKTFRAGKIDAWKDEFTFQHKNMIKQELGQLLIDWGYEKDFDW